MRLVEEAVKTGPHAGARIDLVQWNQPPHVQLQVQGKFNDWSQLAGAGDVALTNFCDLSVRVAGGNGSCRQTFLHRDAAPAPQDLVRIVAASFRDVDPSSPIESPSEAAVSPC